MIKTKATAPDERAAGRSPMLHRLVPPACWAYLACVLGVWVLLRVGADRWWVATVLAYGPRWVWAAPAAALVPIALASRRRRAACAAAAAAAIVAGPVMGLHLSLPTRAAGDRTRVLRVLTCNVNGDTEDPDALFRLIEHTAPDVVALQESSPGDAVAGTLERLGWHANTRMRTKFLSRYPILPAESISSLEGWREPANVYQVGAPFGRVWVVNIHLATPREGLESLIHDRVAAPLVANTAYRREESGRVAARLRGLDGPVLMAGDFNLPCESAIYRAEWSRFTDSFEASGVGFGYTKFTRWWGVRIDHVLAGPGWRVISCRVGPDVGSDHRPLIAELEWVGK